jgi:hypothetical protein
MGLRGGRNYGDNDTVCLCLCLSVFCVLVEKKIGLTVVVVEVRLGILGPAFHNPQSL